MVWCWLVSRRDYSFNGIIITLSTPSRRYIISYEVVFYNLLSCTIMGY